MRSWLPGIVIAVGAAVFLVYGSLAGPKSPPKLGEKRATVLASGFVTFVTDGDTLRLADNRRLRLVQIDAPELPEGECYSEQALNALERLTPTGTEVTPHLDPRLAAKDEHGRYLVYVLKGHENVNLRLVELGAAAPYFYRGERGRYAAKLMAAARRAKASGRGLWGACPGTKLNPDRRVDTGR
jgi:endonuclease YncB( thermonuclease family)